MKTCEQCHKEYDETNVNIPNPLPNGMCFSCGTILTDVEIEILKAQIE
jgi:hypothetical protein